MIFIKEEWKFIDGYDDKYMVSNMGRIKKKSIKTGTYVIANLNLNKKGYLIYTFYKDGIARCMLIHRLVAKYFIPNPNNLPIVNHINENKADARYFNLEWCSQKYNMNVGTVKERKVKSLLSNSDVMLRKVVLLNTGEIFSNINRAYMDTGIPIEDILNSCNNSTFIHNTKTFINDVIFAYYDDVRNIMASKYGVDIYISCEM